MMTLLGERAEIMVSLLHCRIGTSLALLVAAYLMGKYLTVQVVYLEKTSAWVRAKMCPEDDPDNNYEMDAVVER